jgi:hypothetical protein
MMARMASKIPIPLSAGTNATRPVKINQMANKRIPGLLVTLILLPLS